MILKKRIPKDFYKLFRTRNRDFYMMFLVAIYEENNEVYAAHELTDRECLAIIAETMAEAQIAWVEEIEEETEDGETMGMIDAAPSAILKRLVQWGWLKKDYDEKLNSDVLSFPEYSQLFVELFEKLQREEDSRERESILAIYSALYTYQTDKEKNIHFLENALKTSKGLGQLLSNMQDGMRPYFDELSSRKNFLGIQEVLIQEINNSDSKKYAILMTTDSFYRYKEEVKELISQILAETELRKARLLQEKKDRTEGSDSAVSVRRDRQIETCNYVSELICRIEQEFDRIERKYNKLIEQKAVFAKRALARCQYILQEGVDDADNFMRFIGMLNRSANRDDILEDLRNRLRFSAQFRQVTDNSLYQRRERTEGEFKPVAARESGQEEQDISAYIPKPLYTKKELDAFRERNMQGSCFVTTEDTVHSVDDLQKLLFLWQEVTVNRESDNTVILEEELNNQEGLSFSRLIIEDKK